MNKSEQLVYELCTKSFLSLWSYPTPQGKNKSKELCDILIVCDPDIIIFSVKEIAFKDTGRPKIDFDRWHREAVDASCGQIYGAERWIKSNPNVKTESGEIGLPFPELPNRRIHRIAVALGSQGKSPFYFGDFGKGFIHVLDERSLDVLMTELDTISDFVKYLADKENFYRSGKMTLFTGGEEDLLAFYLSQNRTFPDEVDTLVLEDDLWAGFSKDPQVLAKKQLDAVSYIWDEIIEEVYHSYVNSELVTTAPFTTGKLTDIENALRAMARENRFARRNLAENFVEFLHDNKDKKIRARLCQSSVSEILYVFLVSSYDIERKYNIAELYGRCIVARGLFQEKSVVVGICAEFSKVQKGSATTLCYLNIQEWTDEWQEKMTFLQNELEYFKGAGKRRQGEFEYPQVN